MSERGQGLVVSRLYAVLRTPQTHPPSLHGPPSIGALNSAVAPDYSQRTEPANFERTASEPESSRSSRRNRPRRANSLRLLELLNQSHVLLLDLLQVGHDLLTVVGRGAQEQLLRL